MEKKKKAQAMRQSCATICDCHRNNMCHMCDGNVFSMMHAAREKRTKEFYEYSWKYAKGGCWLLLLFAQTTDAFWCNIYSSWVLYNVMYIAYDICYCLFVECHYIQRVQMISTHKQLRCLCNPTFLCCVYINHIHMH